MLASTSEPSEIGAAMFPREVQLSDFVQVSLAFMYRLFSWWGILTSWEGRAGTY